MDKIISPSGHVIDALPKATEYRLTIAEQRIAELEKKLYELHYQICVHVTTEG